MSNPLEENISHDMLNQLVPATSKAIGYEVGDAMSFCVALLRDVNANDAAELVAAVLSPIFEDRNDEYCARVLAYLKQLTATDKT